MPAALPKDSKSCKASPPHENVIKCWQKEPERFKLDPFYHKPEIAHGELPAAGCSARAGGGAAFAAGRQGRRQKATKAMASEVREVTTGMIMFFA